MTQASSAPFGERLRRLRDAAGLTQEELAERAGISRDAIGALERGRRRHPHPETVRALVAGLDLAEGDAAALREAVPKRAGSSPPPPPPPPPAPETRSAPPPVPLTRLVGRQRERADLRRLLTDGGARLVTLTGPGGVGKTRLALELAADLAPAFAGGVAFVAFAAVEDPALVLPTIAEALEVREAGGRSLAAHLGQVLRERRLLLVLDNLEHLVEAAAPVAALLAAAPALVVLATSRAPLRLSGEHEYPLLPLPAPDPDQATDLPSVATNDAVTLFVQRARAARPDFALTAANAAPVAEICARLDGLPLALELAAARVRVLPPAALRERLGTGLRLLTGGPQDQATRLRSMQAAISWSYDLLDPKEQALFRRLAVFAGGFTLDAAEAVTRRGDGMTGRREDDATDGPTSPRLPVSTTAVLDGVASLIEKSLLRRLDADGGEPRFGMLATIREYGLEQLAAAGDEAAVRQAHAAYVVDLAEQAWPAFRQRIGQEPWLDRLEAERGNLRAALGWLDERGDAAALLRLTGALAWFWYMRGPVDEGRSWLRRALAAGIDGGIDIRTETNGPVVDQIQIDDGARAPDRPAALQARALVGAALLAHVQDDDAQAQAWLEASLDRESTAADPWLPAFARLLLGIVAEDRGDYLVAETHVAEALARFRAADDRSNVALALKHLGVAAWGRGDAGRAEALWEEALALQRAAEDGWGVSNSLGYLGLLAAERGDHARAATVLRASLRLRWEARAWEDVAASFADVAVLAAAVGRAEQAARLLGAAAAVRAEDGRLPKLPERALFERAEASARAALGPDAFAAAEAAGRALPRSQAVAAAVAFTDEFAQPRTE